MKIQQTITDIANLIKARNALIWIVSKEEMRVERAVLAAAGTAKYDVRFWDVAAGLQDSTGASIDESLADPQAMIRSIAQAEARCVYVLRDMHAWLDPVSRRAIRNLCRTLASAGRDSARTVIVISPESKLPIELEGHATVVDFPLPDRAEMSVILGDVLERLPDDVRARALSADQRDAAIDAVVGLTADEAANCYARSLVESKTINVERVTAEKKTVIAREKVLTWYEPDPRGLDAIGGLDALKPWAREAALAFAPEARAFGLDAPKLANRVGKESLAPLTGTDSRALRAFLHALELYAYEPTEEARTALRALALCMQPTTRWLAQKAIPGVLDWSHEQSVWRELFGAQGELESSVRCPACRGTGEAKKAEDCAVCRGLGTVSYTTR